MLNESGQTLRYVSLIPFISHSKGKTVGTANRSVVDRAGDGERRLIMTFYSNGNTVYLNCDGSYMTMYICPNTSHYILLSSM